MDDISKALESFEPEIADAFARVVRARFDQIKFALGPTFEGVHNDWSFARVFRLTVAPSARRDERKFVVLDDAKLAANAARHAKDVVAAWEAKIRSKVEDLRDAVVERMTGLEFTIKGTRGGRSIVIRQQAILNVSPRGLVFNQFPARIYVDGELSSEAKFKRLPK